MLNFALTLIPPKRRYFMSAHVEQNRYAVAPVSAPSIPILRPLGQGKRMNIEQIFSVNAIGLREKTHG